jgi:hypothetical protein
MKRNIKMLHIISNSLIHLPFANRYDSTYQKPSYHMISGELHKAERTNAPMERY